MASQVPTPREKLPKKLQQAIQRALNSGKEKQALKMIVGFVAYADPAMNYASALAIAKAAKLMDLEHIESTKQMACNHPIKMSLVSYVAQEAVRSAERESHIMLGRKNKQILERSLLEVLIRKYGDRL